MTDRYPMPHMSFDGCRSIGCEPYAIYGGKVYSFRDVSGQVVVHGSIRYAHALDAVALKSQERTS